MAHQTHGFPIGFDSLPDELLDRIVKLVIAFNRSDAENLARTNRRLQAKIYATLYPVLRVQSTSLGLLTRLRRPRYQFLKEIIFMHVLPTYDCHDCNFLVPSPEIELFSQKFRSVLRGFFVHLSYIDPRFWAHAKLTLELFSPSDHQHWRMRHRSRIASSDAHRQVQKILSDLRRFTTTVDLGHRMVQNEAIPSVDSWLRPFTMTSQPEPLELDYLELPLLNNGATFQELYISRQTCRQIDPKTIVFILERMPMLQKFHYEKWKTPADQPNMRQFVLNTAFLLPCLQTLIIYEEQCPRLRQALEIDRSRSSAEMSDSTPAVVSADSLLHYVPQFALPASQSIQELSVTNYIDGCKFFKNLEATKGCWPALTTLTLTMKDFIKDPRNRQLISRIVTKAALLLPSFPSLDTMRLYNDSLDSACIFTCRNYSALASCRRPTITWKSAWDFTFSDKEKQHWNDATAARRGNDMMPVFLEYRLHVMPDTTHIQVLNSLGVASSVMGYRSRVVKEYEEGMPKWPDS